MSKKDTPVIDIILWTLFVACILCGTWWYVFRFAPLWSRAVDCHYKVGKCSYD